MQGSDGHLSVGAHKSFISDYNYPTPMKQIFVLLLCFNTILAFGEKDRDFEQIAPLLPTPSEVRLATGAPGPDYWQQEANYWIEVELDEKNSRITGSETVEYVNHSPHTLPYLWVQLDQNALAQDSKRQRSTQAINLETDDKKPREVEFESLLDVRNFVYFSYTF